MRTIRLLAFLFALLPAIAGAQQFQNVPDHSVIGRIGSGSASGPSQSILWATLIADLNLITTARNINTTSPLAGGGNLGADLTLTLGTVPVGKGGTGQVTFTQHCVLLGNLTSALNCLNGSAGNSSLPLISQGASLDPVYSQLGLAGIVAGSQDTILGNFNGSSIGAGTIPACTGALTYVSHAFACNSGVGTGTVTSAQVAAGTGIAVTGTCTITTTGTCTVSTTNTPVLLNTLTASGSATLSDTTSLTAAYSMYELVFENIIPATAGSICQLQVHSGGSFQATSYLTSINVSSGAGAFASSAPTTNLGCGSSVQNNIGPGINGRIRVHTPSSTAAPKQMIGELAGNNTTPQTVLYLTNGYWNNSAAIDGFQISMSAGNFSGVIKVYGYP